MNFAGNCPLVVGREEESWILEVFCLSGEKQLYLEQNGASSFGMVVQKHLSMSFNISYF